MGGHSACPPRGRKEITIESRLVPLGKYLKLPPHKETKQNLKQREKKGKKEIMGHVFALRRGRGRGKKKRKRSSTGNRCATWKSLSKEEAEKKKDMTERTRYRESSIAKRRSCVGEGVSAGKREVPGKT